MSKFSVGEIAVITQWYLRPDLVGLECTITGIYKPNEFYDVDINGFGQKDNQGKIYCAHILCLRKKQPPQEELKTWEQLKKDLGMGETKVTVDA